MVKPERENTASRSWASWAGMAPWSTAWRQAETAAATYSGRFIRPSIFREQIPASPSCRASSNRDRSFRDRSVARAPRGGKGQAAGLGAHAPVAAASPQHGAEVALPGHTHAQRPVDKGLQLDGGWPHAPPPSQKGTSPGPAPPAGPPAPTGAPPPPGCGGSSGWSSAGAIRGPAAAAGRRAPCPAPAPRPPAGSTKTPRTPRPGAAPGPLRGCSPSRGAAPHGRDRRPRPGPAPPGVKFLALARAPKAGPPR